MQNDPYSTPAQDVTPPPSFSSGVSAAAIQQLAGTKPWVRFISVLTFIGAGFMGILALAMGVMAATGNIPNFSGAKGMGMAAFYLLLAILYVYPGIKLWKYASAIGSLIFTGRDEDLVTALNHQRSFWKFAGVASIIMLAIYLIAIVAMGVTAGMAAAGKH